MNAPVLERDLRACSSTLHLFALFHLNLAFSSIEEEQRLEVIRRCYWPLLDLAACHGPLGIEATGFTLEEIQRLDPEWIGRLQALIRTGRVELIGSGYAQIIGPLVPAKVTEKNLRIGNELYDRIVGVRPELALVNEQAYGAGLVDLYLDAGYRAILMDWDNPGTLHPEWSRETRYLPQRALSPTGRNIGLIWTSTVAFQKFQRLAHGDIDLHEFASHLRNQQGSSRRALCIYASDAEVFDFRPGRYRTEERLEGRNEWARLRDGLSSIAGESGVRLVAPSDVLALAGEAGANQELEPQSPSCPVPVKKQRKYNLSRWAVTGRDDLAVNAACQRIYEGLIAGNAGPEAWKELCYLWSSDFRTHITEKRWQAFCARLREAEHQHACAPAPFALARGSKIGDRFVPIKTASLEVRLDRRRGLAIESLKLAGTNETIVGGLPHGHFDDIALQADWYTGDCVFEAPGEHKVTDLEWCDASVVHEDCGDIVAQALISTPKGTIVKSMRFFADRPRVEFDLLFDWADWGRGSLRLGHFTLMPDAFAWDELSLTTHNGGKDPETFPLNGHTVEHGAPVSFLVSSSCGIGMTEGWAELGDADQKVRIEIDRCVAPLLGLLTHKKIGGSLFCQLMLSALELDETRKPAPYSDRPRHIRFALNIISPVKH